MRLSRDPDDAGFDTWQQARKEGRTAVIKLDGVVISDVYTADSGTGLIVRAARDADGKIKVEEDQVVTEQLHGTVEITFEGSNEPPKPSVDRDD